jgi:hypothetical protein
MTITEALAELKLIDAKVAKKQEFIREFVTRRGNLVDPLHPSGGSAKVVREQEQALMDLLGRRVAIRLAIQKANMATSLTIGDQSRSIAEWLVWRREVAPMEKAYYDNLRAVILQRRREAQANHGNVVGADQSPSAFDVVVNLDERKMFEKAERLDTTLAALDGQLSLKNATVTIDI